MTKGAEAVRRLPTKDRLELFIKKSGFRGVVLMDRIVLRRGITEAESCWNCLISVKSFFVLGLEIN